MIRFMVLAAPRSGTTWAANWLMHESGLLCLHDPFVSATPTEVDSQDDEIGISCSGSVVMFPEWVRAHPAPKLILHRPFHEINKSLRNIGLPMIDPKVWGPALVGTEGMHIPSSYLFDFRWARRACLHLLGHEPNYGRHANLREMQVQPTDEVIDLIKTLADLDMLNREID